MSARAFAAIAAVAACTAGCGGRWLGARLPGACRRVTESPPDERCVGWFYDRLVVAASDDAYGSPELTAYVTGVADRIARASHLPPPTVRVVDRTTSSASALTGNYIHVWRETLWALDDEAELAAVLSHELVHLVAGHVTDTIDAYPDPVSGELAEARARDDESVADERGVALLVAAGYDPDAMRTALLALERAGAARAEADRAPAPSPPASDATGAAPAPPATPATPPPAGSGAPPEPDPADAAPILDQRRIAPDIDPDDPRHPVTRDRIARVTRVIAGRTGGERAAERYRAHVAGVVIGDDPRRGVMAGNTWLVERVGLAIDLPPTKPDSEREFTITSSGRPWGDAISARLEHRRHTTIAGHPAVIGTTGADVVAARPFVAIPVEAPVPPSDAAVAVITIGERAIAVYVTGPGRVAGVAMVLRGVRAITAAERRLSRPSRLAFYRAPAAGTMRAAVDAVCLYSTSSRLLADPDRHVEAGDPVKCSDR